MQEPSLKQGAVSFVGANLQFTTKLLPPDIHEIREDLKEAQQNRVELQGLVIKMTEDLSRLEVNSKSEKKQVSELRGEKQSLAVKLRDRDEELRGKAKLLEVCLQYLRTIWDGLKDGSRMSTMRQSR